MSYIAIATNDFDKVVRFYGEELGFPTIRAWDRPNGRARVFDLRGLTLEVLDARREQRPMQVEPAGGRFHIVVEVADIEAAHRGLAIQAEAPRDTSWGARVFHVVDPDGLPVWFLQWERGLA